MVQLPVIIVRNITKKHATKFVLDGDVSVTEKTEW